MTLRTVRKPPFVVIPFAFTTMLNHMVLQGQYVQVPVGTGCTVVSGGVGGNVALNQVGHGGIVSMADGFDVTGAGGNFVWVGGTVNSWELQGDISFQTAVDQAAPVPGANPPLQNTGPVATVNIQSYNKNLRASELGSPALGRSKGRVSVEYKGTCDPVLSFEIYKRWSERPPAIVGPNCWPQSNQSVSFSVDPAISDNANDQIGFDQYYWKFTNGGGTDLFASLSTAYSFSPDRSAIQLNMSDPAFQAWFTGGPYKIQCCFGRANPWDGGTGPLLGQLLAGSTCVVKDLPAALAPAYSGGFPTCLNAVSPSTPIAITSTNHNPAYTYNWSRSNLTWSISPNGTGGLSINSIGDGNPCTFILNCSPVNANIGCPATFTYLVNRNYNNASMLAAPSPFCTAPGLFSVNLGASFQNNQTCWGTLPLGWLAQNPTGFPSTVQFTIPAAAAGTSNTINLFSCACPGVTLPIVINVRPATPVFSPAPTTCVALGTPYTYTLVNPGPFTWVHPNWTGPTTGNPVTLTPGPGAPGVISVTRNGQPNCPSIAATVTPSIQPTLPQTAVVQPCYNLGVPAITGNATFTIDPTVFVANGPGAYLWTFPPNSFFNTTAVATTTTVISNGTIASNSQVTRPTTGIPGNYTFTVRFTPSSGTCPFVETVINTVRTTLGTVTYNNNTGLPQNGGPGSLGELVAPSFAPTGTTYQAYDCALPGAYGTVYNSATVPLANAWTVATYSLTVQMTVPQPTNVIQPAPATCIWRPACITTNHKRLVVVDDNGEELSTIAQKEAGLKVMPNPNDGTFTLYLEKAFEVGNVTLWDASGKMAAASKRVTQGNNDMRYDDLPTGMYTLRVELDGEVKVQRVVVTEAK